MTTLERKIGASLDLPEALMPFAAELMRGVDALGSQPLRTAKLLERCGVGRGSTVLDLACGQGGAAVKLAERTGARVTGVDASPEFLRRAEEFAAERGVLCTWVESDVARFRSVKRFDCVMMLNLFPAAKAIGVCRKFVRAGGVMLVDDVALVRRGKARSKRWPRAEDVAAELAASGDEVVEIEQCCRPSVDEHAVRIEKRVRVNGAELVGREPRLKRAVAEYLRRLEDSRELLTGPIRPTLFVIRRVN
jgi:SAM-dependent methyltransferase